MCRHLPNNLTRDAVAISRRVLRHRPEAAQALRQRAPHLSPFVPPGGPVFVVPAGNAGSAGLRCGFVRRQHRGRSIAGRAASLHWRSFARRARSATVSPASDGYNQFARSPERLTFVGAAASRRRTPPTRHRPRPPANAHRCAPPGTTRCLPARPRASRRTSPLPAVFQKFSIAAGTYVRNLAHRFRFG